MRSTADHDPGAKHFSHAFQNRVISGRTTKEGMEQEVDELINMIFDQNALSEFICRKLYRFYVHYKITAEIENDIIQPMAQTFRNIFLRPSFPIDIALECQLQQRKGLLAVGRFWVIKLINRKTLHEKKNSNVFQKLG